MRLDWSKRAHTQSKSHSKIKKKNIQKVLNGKYLKKADPADFSKTNHENELCDTTFNEYCKVLYKIAQL